MISILTNECLLSLTLVFLLWSQCQIWSRRSSAASETAVTPCTAHSCWRVRWRRFEVSSWARWTTWRSCATYCVAHSRNQKSGKRPCKNLLQGWGETSPVHLRFISSWRLETPLFIWNICLTAHPEGHNVSHWFTHSCATRCCCNISVG